MEPEGSRRLAAIMFTDIVGYTALMAKSVGWPPAVATASWPSTSRYRTCDFPIPRVGSEQRERDHYDADHASGPRCRAEVRNTEHEDGCVQQTGEEENLSAQR